MLIPYHPGAIRYLKEVKLWTGEMEKKQQKLIQEQNRLKKVWDEALAEATSKGMKEQDFPEFWDEEKRARLSEIETCASPCRRGLGPSCRGDRQKEALVKMERVRNHPFWYFVYLLFSALPILLAINHMFRLRLFGVTLAG